MIPFLKGFLNNLNTVQSKQILRILNQMNDRGEIRNNVEFEKKLTELANLIQDEHLTQRTPAVFFENGELLESDTMRTFVDLTKFDIEAALGETERLSNSMRAHNRILVENYFDSMEAALSDLQAETRAYEVLENQKFTGFSSVIKRFTFDGPISTPGADTDDPFVSSLFIDSRGGQELTYSSPNRGERGLRLGINNTVGEKYSYFDKVEIRNDSTTPQTALSTSMLGNTPIKAIDGDRDTAWRHSVLLSEDPNICRLIFAPSFTGAQRVNALVIEPLADVSIKIHSIAYIDSGGIERNLSLGANYSGSMSSLFFRSSLLGARTISTSDWIIPNTRIVIPVGDIVAREFIVTFQQDSGIDGDFFYFNRDLASWSENTPLENYLVGLFRESGDTVGFEIAQDFHFIGDSSEDREQARFSEYVFGLKEISTLSREYKPNSLFVPEPFQTAHALSTLALYSDIETPIGELTDVEFLIRKENYDSNDSLLDVETIPMLSYGSTSINERLFLSTTQSTLVIKDTGVLRFYPDFTETLTVYQDDIALTIGTDYEVSIDLGNTFETSLPPSGTASDPLKCFIKINSPQAGTIYSISYTPLVSSSDAGGEVWLNEDHTVRLGRFQTYIFDNQRPAGTIVKSKIGLQIILRANTLNTRVSPFLREVVFLGG
jgi:hypothetical protein